MNNKLEQAKNEMFARVEDPLNTRWWEVAWEALHDKAYGSVIDDKTSAVEEAIWLLELRNIHAVYEAVFYGWEYEPMWLEWWNFTGIPEQDLIASLSETHAFEVGGNSVSNTLHTLCWSKRQKVYDVLLEKFEDETILFMFFVGNKVPKGERDRTRVQSICNWVDEAFDY